MFQTEPFQYNGAPLLLSKSFDPEVWITKFDERIPVCKMETGHLVNSVMMIRRKYAELGRTCWEIPDICPQYPAMICEIKNRNVGVLEELTR